jgi:hypothetical protein
MNWMGASCFLIGVAMGIEIAYLVMKYRYDAVAKEVRTMNERISEALGANNQIIGKWSEAVDLNTKLIEELEKRD